MDCLTYKDAIFATSADTFEYVIKYGADCIFRGVAVKAPDADYNYINVGEICRQYLSNGMADFADFESVTTNNSQAFLTFVLFSVTHTLVYTGPETFVDDVSEEPEQIFKFLYNWDYVTEDMEDRVLSDPINGKLDCRMKLMYTEFQNGFGSSFYVTPLLSAPSSGATVHADIVTDYTNISALTLNISDSSITFSNLSLTGVDFIVPPNTGYTFSTVVYFYYYGSLVGTTTIISAGDLGDKGIITGGTPDGYNVVPKYSDTIYLPVNPGAVIWGFNYTDWDRTYSASIDDPYFYVEKYSGIMRTYYTNSMWREGWPSSQINIDGINPPSGYTTTVTIDRNGEAFKTVQGLVTFRYGKQSIRPYLIENKLSIYNVRPMKEWRGTLETGVHFDIDMFNILDQELLQAAGYKSLTAVTNGWLEISNPVKMNGFYIRDGHYNNVKLKLPAETIFIHILDQTNGNGITEIYIDCTKAYFNSLPVIEDDGICRIGKIYYAQQGHVIRVRCVDGTVLWRPNGQ